MAENGSDVSLKIAGQEVNVRNVKSLNTIATVLTLFGVCLLGYVLFTHAADTREAGKELVQVMKDMTQATREQTCIISLPQDKREQNVELCKRISR